MKYLKQFCIIMLVCFAGELVRAVLPLPVPASIWGLVIMLVLLTTKVIKPEQVRETAVFMIEIMPIMFVPSTVGLMNSWGQIKDNVLLYLLITFVTTIVVMVVSGRVTQRIMGKKKAEE